MARAWTEAPPAIRILLKYPVTRNSLIYFRLGLRRDLVAWNRDESGLNFPFNEGEVDLNEPDLGYFRVEETHWSLTAGRFPVHWSASPDFGLALSNAVPYHNGLEIAFAMPHVHYRFLVSSLNPWLAGTPSGDSSGVDFPPGSEEYRQRHYPAAGGASNFHNRVYDARAKTLFAHRLEARMGRLTVGITETQVIGGKAPDFRDAGPFIVFHNDFKEGFTNGNAALDASFRLPWGITIAGEYYVEDVNYSATESGGKPVNLQGYMLGARHAFTIGRWALLHRVHAIHTDPFLYNYNQPLSSMASRHILSSNNQKSGDSLFVDKFVVDYPVGYLRGGDALDFWYRLDAWPGARSHLGLDLALLSRGEIDLATPFERYFSTDFDHRAAPEREFRIRLRGDYRFAAGLTGGADVAWQSILNHNHAAARRVDELQAGCSLAWSLPN